MNKDKKPLSINHPEIAKVAYWWMTLFSYLIYHFIDK
jgi:hypothetical protein